MPKELVLISHGKMAEGIKESCELIMGPQDNIHAVCLLPEEGPDKFKEKFIKETDNLSNVTVFCDLMGGTPCNVVSRLIMEGKDLDLVAGMNLPMVIGFVNSQMTGLDTDYVEEAKKGTVNVRKYLSSMKK